MKKKQPYEKFSGVTTNTTIYYHGVYKPDKSRLLTAIKKMRQPLCTCPVCPIEGNHSCMCCVKIANQIVRLQTARIEALREFSIGLLWLFIGLNIGWWLGWFVYGHLGSSLLP